MGCWRCGRGLQGSSDSQVITADAVPFAKPPSVFLERAPEMVYGCVRLARFLSSSTTNPPPCAPSPSISLPPPLLSSFPSRSFPRSPRSLNTLNPGSPAPTSNNPATPDYPTLSPPDASVPGFLVVVVENELALRVGLDAGVGVSKSETAMRAMMRSGFLYTGISFGRAWACWCIMCLRSSGLVGQGWALR